MGDYHNPGTSNVKVEIILNNYVTKGELKNTIHVDTSNFALKTNLASLKPEVDKFDIPKLTTVPQDLSKLTKEVQEDFTKKTDFNSLNTKVNQNGTNNNNLESKVKTTETSITNLKTKVDNIDLTKYVLKSNYDTKIGNLDLQIPDVGGLLQTISFNRTVTELEKKIKIAESKPDITNLATKSSATAVENKIPDINGFVKKTDYATEISSMKND